MLGKSLPLNDDRATQGHKPKYSCIQNKARFKKNVHWYCFLTRASGKYTTVFVALTSHFCGDTIFLPANFTVITNYVYPFSSRFSNHVKVNF